MTSETGASYAGAGVSIEAGDDAVEMMKVWVDKARRPEMVGGIGGFAGLFDASALKQYDHPLLATSADGVGTKVAIAQALDKHDTIGFDLVGMLVDDLVVCGAEPLFLTDYIACGRVVPERIAAIVKGIAEACLEAGCALIGGETAEHPGLLEPDEYDVAGSTTGVVEAGALLGPGLVRAGDVVVAMAASGLHANGYSLVRHVLLERAGWSLDRTSTTSAAPSARSCSNRPASTPRPASTWLASTRTHAMSHVTGGGLAANLERVLPPSSTPRSTARPGRCRRCSTWSADVGDVARDDLERTLNCGVGMVALSAASDADTVIAVPRRARDRRLGGRRGDRGHGRDDAAGCAGSRWSATTADRSTRGASRRPDVRECTIGQVRLTHERDDSDRRPLRPGQAVRGGRPMGRGRAKAKQTKVARDLKYRTHETDFGALAKELHGEDGRTVRGQGAPRDRRVRRVVRLLAVESRLTDPAFSGSP